MKFLFVSILMIASVSLNGQSYKASMKADICTCLEEEKAKNRLHSGSYMPCFRRALTKYAKLIEAEIDEEDPHKKLQKGLEAKLELQLELQPELVHSCDVYFEYLDTERTQKFEYLSQKGNPKMIEYLDEQIALVPSHTNYTKRAYAHQMLGNLGQAEADAKNSIAINPSADNVNSVRGELTLLAEIYEQQGKYKTAIATLDKIPKVPFQNHIDILKAYLGKKAGGNATILKETNNIEKSKQAETIKQKVKSRDSSDMKKLFKIDHK